MFSRYKNSTNYSIYRNIKTKIRQFEVTQDISYILVFTFCYKYCSDSLKDYFLTLIENKEITLDEAFKSPEYKELFKDHALHMFGYYIGKSEAFIDEMINNNYQNSFFISQFVRDFSDNIEFLENSNDEKYFNFIFKSLSDEVNLDKFDIDNELNLFVKELIYAISKLDIHEEEMSFAEIFDFICNSRLIKVDRDPEYINQLFSKIISSQKFDSKNIYNPFVNDGSSLIKLSGEEGFEYFNAYGKCSDRLTFCCLLVKLLIHYFNFSSVFLEYDNALESISFEDKSFDVIFSKLPSVNSRDFKSSNKTQNIEISKRNKRRQLEDLLSLKFNLNEESFSNDDKLNDALENLLEKMDVKDNTSEMFTGEFESLRDSEYLFLINLITSLNNDGLMVISITNSFLFKNSLETLRKYLTSEKNYIDVIINLPEDFSRYRRSEVICIFKKNKLNNDIQFIDLSQCFNDKSVKISRDLFKRSLLFDEESIKKVIDVYSNRLTIDKFSRVVDLSEIEFNEYNLSISRYVDTFDGEFIKLNSLKHEKEEITANIKKLNKDIDLMMDELNLKF